MIGPPSVEEPQEACATDQHANQDPCDSLERPFYEQFAEPRTGEVLYKIVR
jgi:hypothetical protein